MTKAVFFILALSVLAGCGGAVQSAVPIQPKDSVIPVNPYLNASMIGQTWVFQNADATCTTTYRLKPAPSSSYFPAGSIVLNITKSSADCYWAYGTDQASIDFVLSPLADGSFNSLGWVAHFPGALPDWSPFHVYSQQVQTPAGAATPYMIVPAPTLDASSSIVIETTYDRWTSTARISTLSFRVHLLQLCTGKPRSMWSTAMQCQNNGKAFAVTRNGRSRLTVD